MKWKVFTECLVINEKFYYISFSPSLFLSFPPPLYPPLPFPLYLSPPLPSIYPLNFSPLSSFLPSPVIITVRSANTMLYLRDGFSKQKVMFNQPLSLSKVVKTKLSDRHEINKSITIKDAAIRKYNHLCDRTAIY